MNEVHCPSSGHLMVSVFLIEKTVLSPYWIDFSALSKNSCRMCGSISALDPIDLYVCLDAISHCPQFYNVLKSSNIKLPTLFFFFKVVFAILGPLHFHINFRITMWIFKNACWDIDRDSTEHTDKFGGSLAS